MNHHLAFFNELHVQWRGQECVLDLGDSQESLATFMDFLRKHDAEKSQQYLATNQDFRIVVSPTGEKRFSGQLRYKVELQYSNGDSKPLDLGTPDNVVSYLLVLLFQKAAGGFCNKHMEKRATSRIIVQLYDLIYGGGNGGRHWVSQKSRQIAQCLFDHHGINQCMSNLRTSLKHMAHLNKAELEACDIVKERKSFSNHQVLNVRTVNIPAERIEIRDNELLSLAHQIPSFQQLSCCERRA